MPRETEVDYFQKLLDSPKWDDSMWRELRDALSGPAARAALRFIFEEQMNSERRAGMVDFSQPNAIVTAQKFQGTALGIRRVFDILIELSTSPVENSKEGKDE